MKKLSTIDFRLLTIFLSFIFINCTNSPQSSEKTKTDSVKVSAVSDSLTIDLVALKSNGFLKNPQQIVVENDPVYHKKKKFNALPLKDILEKYSAMKQLKASETKIVFECEDGYKPEMPLEKLLSAKAFLAISDAEAPAGRDWEQILKDGHEMKAAPFYVIYEGVSPKNGDYKWPYNLVKIHFAPSNENLALITPKDASTMKGFELFQQRCQTCHAINKIGGKMGPELNFPKSITEYWKTEDLKAYIKNPAAYRNDVKMPTLNLQDADIEEIVKYLEVMAKQKVGGFQ